MSTTLIDEIEICEIAKKFELSFDKDFDKTDVKRKEPFEII